MMTRNGGKRSDAGSAPAPPLGAPLLPIGAGDAAGGTDADNERQHGNDAHGATSSPSRLKETRLRFDYRPAFCAGRRE
jgi:hypothetical protein